MSLPEGEDARHGALWPPTRRSLLQWLGNSAAISLTSPLLAACAGAVGPDFGDSGFGGCTSDGIAFDPDTARAEVFAGWPVRTVDSPDFLAILKSWKLEVDGLVHRSRSFSFDELLALARRDQVTDFHCVEGWSVWDVPWNGLHLGAITTLVGVLPGATHVTLHTDRDAYNESVPIDVALEPHTLLAYGVCGSTLPREHGFPLRLVVPRLFGYKNAKYVTRLEFSDHPVEGFWVQHGYDYDGEVPQSRLREGKY
jgi:DMSO/TMAO reductase YedYZ molybdopterin-dependent catalytic subunit